MQESRTAEPKLGKPSGGSQPRGPGGISEGWTAPETTRQIGEDPGIGAPTDGDRSEEFGVLLDWGGGHGIGSASPEGTDAKLWCLEMNATSHTIRLETRGECDILDLTDSLQDVVRESGVVCGQANAMVVGSTAALSTLEYEPGLVNRDIEAALEEIAPQEGRYEHEKTWGDDNGHSHVRATLLGPSLALPVVDGEIPFGTWQQPVLVDLDTRPRSRTVVVTVVGE